MAKRLKYWTKDRVNFLVAGVTAGTSYEKIARGISTFHPGDDLPKDWATLGAGACISKHAQIQKKEKGEGPLSMIKVEKAAKRQTVLKELIAARGTCSDLAGIQKKTKLSCREVMYGLKEIRTNPKYSDLRPGLLVADGQFAINRSELIWDRADLLELVEGMKNEETAYHISTYRLEGRHSKSSVKIKRKALNDAASAGVAYLPHSRVGLGAGARGARGARIHHTSAEDRRSLLAFLEGGGFCTNVSSGVPFFFTWSTSAVYQLFKVLQTQEGPDGDRARAIQGHRAWSEADIELLIELRRVGTSYKVISNSFVGSTRQSCMCKFNRLLCIGNPDALEAASAYMLHVFRNKIARGFTSTEFRELFLGVSMYGEMNMAKVASEISKTLAACDAAWTWSKKNPVLHELRLTAALEKAQSLLDFEEFEYEEGTAEGSLSAVEEPVEEREAAEEQTPVAEAGRKRKR